MKRFPESIIVWCEEDDDVLSVARLRDLAELPDGERVGVYQFVKEQSVRMPQPVLEDVKPRKARR